MTAHDLDRKTSEPSHRARLHLLGAAALGLSIPLLLAGRSMLAVAAVIALVGLLGAIGRKQLVRGINNAFKSALGCAVWLTFSLWLISVVGSPDIAKSGEIWLRMVLLLIAGTALCCVLRERSDLNDLVLRVLVAAALVCAILGLVALHVLPETFAWLRGHGEEIAISDIAAQIMKSYGTVVACLMPVVLWAGWRIGGGWQIAALVFQAAAIALLFSLQSRSGLVAAGLALGVVGTWMAWRRFGLIGVTVVLALALAMIVAVAMDSQRNNQIDAALGLPLWLLDAHRQSIWAFALEQVHAAPYFGIGPDMVSTLPGSAGIVDGSTVEVLPSHPHNVLIEVLIETGAIGLAAMATALLFLFAGALRAMRRDGAAGAAVLGLSAAFWFASLISYSFWSFWWQATYILLLVPVVATLTPGGLSTGLGLRGQNKT
ncbi:MAG: O-antigen ligase family protein [Alphaproteobacteria bacterium]|jgi:O-antigen ligase|nr:O-antigen ligase family protein [Rhodospirillaceae bacterium]MBT7615609.1 O-antigen ligase family protein [Rhodospirillaceae bacterium]MBT7646972.1 O-antigen ligase family protein [Rhodospirillaceae bacterium]MDG2481370.1 O-antigen ligase family protein [Alphaproteobacteria bacterium]